jgi:branched-chain amino acid transport system substrate-binding protein
MAAALAVVFLFTSLVSSPAGAQIKIGFQAPVTGLAATDGKSAQIAAEMAIADINAAGGVLGQRVQLVSYDDQAKADQAIFTANKLIGEDKVKLAISGSYSGAGRAAAPIFQNARVVFISAYGVHPDITRAGDYVFRLVILGPPQGRAAAMFIGKNLNLKRVSVISMDNDYGEATLQGFLSAVDRFGIKIVHKYTYSLQDRQFGSIVASVKRDNPDAIYTTGYFFTGAPLVAQLRAAGVKVPIIASQAFDSRKFIEIAGPAANGVYIVDSFDRYRNDPPLRRFFQEFEKRAGYPPEQVAAGTYSSFLLLADAIKRARSTDPAKVRDALAATRNFPLLTGNLVGFNKLHEVIKPVAINVVRNNQFVHFATIDDLKLLAPPDK